MQIALNEKGIEAYQIVMERLGDDNHTVLLPNEQEINIRRLIMECERKLSLHGMIYPYLFKLMDMPEFKKSNIVHYHLLHNYFGALPILPEITKKKPSVLTIHDPWLLTGHCIHPLKCKKWQYGCGFCENLDINFSMREDRTALQWQIKRDVFARTNIDLVVASEWMLDLVRQSPIMSTIENVHLIPFGINVNLFSAARDKHLIRQKLRIPDQNFTLCFRADPSPFKGLSTIFQMLDILKPSKPVTLLAVGNPGELEKFKHKYQVIDIPWITDNEYMADIYCASDIFIMPSIADSFGLMAIEAMASSRPVLVCEGTALPNITFAPECGIVIPQNDYKAMADAICRIMEHPEEQEKRGKMGRNLAEKYYRFEDYLERHLNLYEEILSRKK